MLDRAPTSKSREALATLRRDDLQEMTGSPLEAEEALALAAAGDDADALKARFMSISSLQVERLSLIEMH